ncbi:MAG: ORF6N domain-containing protein [Bacteroidales bacterium]|nr:ORF6N domain-containing protein [Bacteroidales bacterium]
MNSSILKQTAIESLIHEIRGQKVMLDFDLAELYQVETKRLKESVRRNIERFEGDDFMFELTSEEYNSLIISLRSQIATSNERGGRRHMPFAFTEQGVAMLSSVLKSERAIQVNRSIIRAFVAMRNYIMSTKTITSELEAIKAKLELLERNDEDNLEAINDLSEDMRREIDTIYQAIAALSVKESTQKEPQRQKIGFKTNNKK